MTQPYPQQYGQPAAPQYAAPQPQQYAPQPGYQQPQQYGQPAAPQYAQQPQQYGYPQNQGAYPVAQPQQQQYAPQAAPPMPTPASLDGFYNQPSAGWGPAWQLGNAVQNGTSYIGIVAQWITRAHLEYATSKNQMGVEEVRTFKNGDPIVNLKVPLNVVPDQRFTEGRAQFYVGPSEKDLLGAAIAAAGGDPTQPPPLGSMIRATKTGSRGNIHGGQSAIKSVEYWPPEQAQQFAAQLGIPYPDLSTPRPVEEAAKHAAPEAADGGTGGNFAPAPVSAGPAVQQQAAPPQPVAQHLPAAPAAQAQFPAGGAPMAAQPPAGVPGVPAGGLSMPPAPAPPAAPPVGPPAVPSIGAVPSDPAKADLLARLTGQAPQAAAS